MKSVCSPARVSGRPNVQMILGCGCGTGSQTLCIASPWYELGTLASFLKSSQKDGLTPVDAKRMMVDICQCIHQIHEAGVSHRDHHYENILLSDSGNGVVICRVSDLGLAVDASALTTLASDGLLYVGMTRFRSPELLHHR